MNREDYFWLTSKKEPKTKPKSRLGLKPTQTYLEVEEFTQALDVFGIEYEKKFQLKNKLGQDLRLSGYNSNN